MLEKRLCCCDNVLHCENPLKVEDDWIRDYNLKDSSFDITAVDRDLATIVPTALEMGEVVVHFMSRHM